MRQGKAAVEAGFSPENADAIAARLMKKPHIKVAIDKAMADRSKRTEITQDYVLETIRDTIERCKGLKPVTIFGQPILVKTSVGKKAAICEFDSRGVLKGSELLGRHLGMWNDKLEVTEGERPLKELSDKELMELAKGDA